MADTTIDKLVTVRASILLKAVTAVSYCNKRGIMAEDINWDEVEAGLKAAFDTDKEVK